MTSTAAATSRGGGPPDPVLCEPAAPPAPPVEAPAAARKGRYEFLDALRGIAAMAVVLQHSAEFIWPEYLKFSIGVFRLGEFGVILFFMVSGFIIPASLEKYDSVPRFWVGRFFRLFPLYWACVLAALVLAAAGRFYLPEPFLAEPVRWTMVNLTMVQQFVEGPLVIGASWSLAYEMVFYLAMSIMLLCGANRRSVPIAVTLLGAAGIAGTYLPGRLVTGDQGPRGLLVVLSVTAAVVLVVLAKARTNQHRMIGVGLAVVAVPLALNQPERAWFSLLLFATMAVGTVLYRMSVGAIPRWQGWGVLAGAAVVMAVVHRVHVDPHIEPIAGAYVTYKPEVLTFSVAFGVFGLGLLLRGRSWPRPLTYLGRISYSLYLVHTLVLYAVPWWTEAAAARLGLPNTWLTYATWVLLSVLVSALTYKYIEDPFQKLGHRLTKMPRKTALVQRNAGG